MVKRNEVQLSSEKMIRNGVEWRGTLFFNNDESEYEWDWLILYTMYNRNRNRNSKLKNTFQYQHILTLNRW